MLSLLAAVAFFMPNSVLGRLSFKMEASHQRLQAPFNATYFVSSQPVSMYGQCLALCSHEKRCFTGQMSETGVCYMYSAWAGAGDLVAASNVFVFYKHGVVPTANVNTTAPSTAASATSTTTTTTTTSTTKKTTTSTTTKTTTTKTTTTTTPPPLSWLNSNVGNPGVAAISMELLPTGDLAIGSSDGRLRVWKNAASTMLIVHAVHAVTASINDLLMLSNGKLITCGSDNLVRFCDLSALPSAITCVTTNGTGHTGSVNKMAMLGNGNVASAGDDFKIKTWDQNTAVLVKTWATGHNDSIRDLIILASGDMVSCSLDMTLKIWDSSNMWSLLKTITLTVAIHSVVELPNTNLACGLQNGMIQIIQISNGAQVKLLAGSGGKVYRMAILDNGYLASVAWDMKAKIFNGTDAISTAAVMIFGDATDDLMALCVLPNSLLAVGGMDTYVRVFHTP